MALFAAGQQGQTNEASATVSSRTVPRRSTPASYPDLTGTEPYQAIVDAAVTRLRLILMATVTTILGLMPLIISGTHCSSQWRSTWRSG